MLGGGHVPAPERRPHEPDHAGLLLSYVFFWTAALHPSMVTLSEPIPHSETKLT